MFEFLTELFREMDSAHKSGTITFVAFFACVTVFLVLTYFFKAVAVIFRGWPPEYEDDDDDDDDDNPSGTFRTTTTHTPVQ